MRPDCQDTQESDNFLFNMKATADSIRVISVNPANLTKGELHPEAWEASFKKVSEIVSGSKLPKSCEISNFIFGINRNTTRSKSAYLFLARLVASALIITSAVMIFGSVVPASVGFSLIALGVVAFFGICLRPLSAIAAIASGYLAFTLVPGSINLILAGICLISSILAVLGPGRFSVDSLLRRTVFNRERRRRNAARKAAEMRLSYKAFLYANS